MYIDNNFLVLRTRKRYSRTDSGKSWRSKPYEIVQDIFNTKQYINFVEATPLFNRLGWCRASRSYTAAGYIPDHICTISPYRDTRLTDDFEFLSLNKLKKDAGARELDILERVKSWSEEWQPGHHLIKLCTAEDAEGHKDGAVFDIFNNKWVG